MKIMNNEDKILNILQQIQNDIKDLKSDVKDLKEGQTRIESLVTELDPKNASRHVELNNSIDELHKDVKFIKHKLHVNEEEIFDIKDKLRLVK
jgi:chromosome segregation ATPase